jgi:Trypsin-like serine proteases, typically periplasmic, contain C-terminal PDZ domain
MNEEYNNNPSGDINNNPSGTNNSNSSGEISSKDAGTYSYSNEYQNNNSSDGYYNQNIGQNYDPNNAQNYYQNSEQSYQNYSSGNAGPTNYQSGSNDTYTVYPTPQMNEEKKAKVKKKKRGFGVFKLTAAAVAFGLIAGAVFQGYYFAMKVTGNLSDTGAQNSVKIAEASGSKDTIVPETTSSSDAIVTDVSDVVTKVMPSIVAINSSGTQTTTDFFGREYSQQVEGSGSGIIIGQNDSQLLIVTNNHVVQGASKVEIVFSDKSKATAVVKGSDSNADLAVLSVDMKTLSESTANTIRVATLGDSKTVEAGDMAIAIGNALGYGQSVTVGYISAVNREVTINNNTMTLLQTDAAINPGNSGGALLNSKGQVIGINSVKYASEEVEGMGYAIPISSAIPMINELMNRHAVSKSQQGFLGINTTTAQNVTQEISDAYGIPVGIYVNDVISGSPSEKAGLERGDIITGVDGVTVKTIDELANALSYKKAGQKIELKIKVKVSGAYQDKSLNVTLGKKSN